MMHDFHQVITPVEDVTGSHADCGFSNLEHLANNMDVRLDDYSRTFFQFPDNLRSTIFSASEKTHIDVVDVETTQVKTETIRDSDGIEILLHVNPTVKCRYVSIYAQSSIEPLGISYADFFKLISHGVVSTLILELVAKFGRKPRNAEAGAGRPIVHTSVSGLSVMHYIVSYPEPKQYGGEDKWRKATMRQTGVYCSQQKDRDYTLWVFLHPRKDSPFQQHLEQKLRLQEMCDESERSIHLPHTFVLSCYLENWQCYLNALNEEFESLGDAVLTFDLRGIDSQYIHAERLLDLRHLADLVFPISTRLEATLATINTLFGMMQDLEAASTIVVSDELKAHKVRTESYLASSKLLARRIEGITSSLAMTLDIQSREMTVETNNAMLQLTHDTVGDSATVRVVTLVTMIYLPASFVATVLGTNLFTFGDNDGSGFQVSRQFWIFVVISVPLTILTVGAWFVVSRGRGRRGHPLNCLEFGQAMKLD